MSIDNRNLPAGTVLVATFKKQAYTCTVLQTDEGKTAYSLDGDNRVFSSPSAAGSAVMGGVACNGWRFWSVQGTEPSKTESEPAPAARAGKKAKPRSTLVKQIRRVPNNKGLEEGQARWFCSACMKGFIAPAASEPDACPEGHPREVEDELAPKGMEEAANKS